MIEGLTLHQMARESQKVFLLALEEFGLPVLDECASEPGWLNVGEYFGSLESDITLKEAAHQAMTHYLLGAALPADYLLAEQVFEKAWQAVSVHMHGLIAAEPDEHDLVITHTAAWIESQHQSQHEGVPV